MMKRRDGAIVTLGGLMALAGAKNRVHGSVVKHGLVGITMKIESVLLEFHGTRKPPPPGPEEIAAMVRFLCGPGASFISGQTIHVNGAQMMY